MELENETTLFVYANEYYKSALALSTITSGLAGRAPTYYLFGHSIELSYKAYLYTNGVDLNTLKRKIGHNLETALSKAKELGFFHQVSDPEFHQRIICELNNVYSEKEFEYMTQKQKTLPFIDDVSKVAKEAMDIAFNSVAQYP